jgi:hypothetical protein
MVRTYLFLSIFCLLASALRAQTPTYQGWRLSVHQFEEIKASKIGVTFTCQVVNTGRELVSFGKGVAPHAQLVCEVDTFSLPKEIKGRRDDICAALFAQRIDLVPGAAFPKLKLFIPVSTQSTPIVGGTVVTNTQAGTSVNETYDYEQSCPDLRFDTAYIVDQSKSNITIRYILRNTGGSTARLLGNTDAQEDNMAVNVYFNRATKITRGALLGGGSYLSEGKETTNGLLFPNARIFGEVTVPKERLNKFAPHIILELDPFMTLVECDKKNNTFVILGAE